MKHEGSLHTHQDSVQRANPVKSKDINQLSVILTDPRIKLFGTDPVGIYTERNF